MTFGDFKRELAQATTEEVVKATYAASDTIHGIHVKLDRLTDESQRRFEGEFYTPLRFATKAIHYLTDVLGKKWCRSGKYRIWDMAAGTGNLEYHLPIEAYKYLYLSTFHTGEAEHRKKVFPGATCFQYDYLNDDVEYVFNKDELPFVPNWKLPQKLRDELADPSITWVVYINPPFATAQDAKRKKSKTGVGKTKIDIQMDKAKTGHAKRELLVQFMFRIIHELPKKTYVGMFAKLYLNAPDSAEYRDKFFNYRYEKGFLFHSNCFHGVTGDFPVTFLIWNLSKQRERKIVDIDISDTDTKTIGVKHVQLINKGDVLNKWVERPANSKNYILPPLSNAITVTEGNTDIRHRARPDLLASISSRGNDFQHNRYIAILSSPSVSAGAFTVVQENFEKAVTLYAVRKIPEPTWINDRDPFLTPHTEPSKAFMSDCVVWSLFSNANETTALKNVRYLGKTYQIKNNFYPFPLKEVLEQAKIVYKLFYANLHQMVTHKWKIDTWDAGWYQIRRCLKEHNLATDELKEVGKANEKLADKIRPQIEAYGFLDKDEIEGDA